MKPILIIVALSAILFLASVIINNTSIGSGPGDPPEEDAPLVEPVEEPDFEPEMSADDVYDASVYARIRSTNFFGSAVIFGMEIKAHPMIEGEEFPTITHEGIQNEMNIYAMVRLRGASAPRNVMNDGFRLLRGDIRARPHVETEREESRFDEIMAYVRSIRAISSAFILKNIAVEETVHGKQFVADVFYVVGGMERNLFDDLFNDGFVVNDEFGADFGKRIP